MGENIFENEYIRRNGIWKIKSLHVYPQDVDRLRQRLGQGCKPAQGPSSDIENGIWKFRTMDLDYTWTADYRTGWTQIDDNSKGIVTTPFPKIVDLPFHYLNPVTKRKPPLFVP